MTKRITIERVGINHAIRATWTANHKRHYTCLFPVGMESAAREEAQRLIAIGADSLDTREEDRP